MNSVFVPEPAIVKAEMPRYPQNAHKTCADSTDFTELWFLLAYSTGYKSTSRATPLRKSAGITAKSFSYVPCVHVSRRDACQVALSPGDLSVWECQRRKDKQFRGGGAPSLPRYNDLPKCATGGGRCARRRLVVATARGNVIARGCASEYARLSARGPCCPLYNPPAGAYPPVFLCVSAAEAHCHHARTVGGCKTTLDQDNPFKAQSAHRRMRGTHGNRIAELTNLYVTAQPQNTEVKQSLSPRTLYAHARKMALLSSDMRQCKSPVSFLQFTYQPIANIPRHVSDATVKSEEIWASLNSKVLRATIGHRPLVASVIVKRMKPLFILFQSQMRKRRLKLRPRWLRGYLSRLPLRRSGFNARPGYRTFACGNRAGRCFRSSGFLRDLPFPPPFNSGAVPYSPQSPSSTLKTSLRRAIKISSLTRRLKSVHYVFRNSVKNSGAPTNVPLILEYWGGGGAVARALASHHGDPGSIPGGLTPEFSHVGLVVYDAVYQRILRIFSGYSRFPCPSIPAQLHPRVSFHVMSGDDGHVRVPAGKSVTRRVLPRPGSTAHNTICIQQQFGCCLLEKAFSCLTRPLRLQQNRYGSYLIHVQISIAPRCLSWVICDGENTEILTNAYTNKTCSPVD
ncbi:hypothetical protein PR048_014131 [Dryococelus australis]|uniref:Uncharacterized protein n=1 Tax=Dryococelus australis TaxID=614101 RepID=A0ABQ9HDH4_9NEOP|nr:hypothetical protein PR048_014131 [Dryococelus australis]